MADTRADTPSGSNEKDFVALPIGTAIGRYEITAVLGRGGFGITYRARDAQLHRDVAIKEYLPTALAIRHNGITVLPNSTKTAEDFAWGRQRFVEEGRTLASLHNAPAIVRVHDFLEANGTAYIVMELVSGVTLEQRLKDNGPLSQVEIEQILWPMLDGLAEVHGIGFLHRDIKPANVLINAKGEPTLIDFGASRAAMAGRTTAMTAVFTPGYAAAEQFTSAKQGPWTDIYGLSATLYHAIIGKPPPSAFDRMLEDKCQPLESVAPRSFSLELLKGIDAGLAVRAPERPQSIDEWRPLLRGAAELSSRNAGQTTVAVRPRAVAQQPSPQATTPITGTAPASTTESPATIHRSRGWLYAGGVALVVLLLAGGGWFVLTPKSTPAALSATSLQDMKVEDLEKILADRRKAEAAAAEEKRRQEEEAQKKAAANAAAKQAADAELQRAQAERHKAEAELNRLKTEMETQQKVAAEQQAQATEQARREAAAEAQRKMEADMAALKAAEEEALRKAAANAEAKRQADQALAKAQADRLKAEADAKARADADAKALADAKAKAQADADAKAKADAEVKMKADADTKTKTDAEAKLQVDPALADKKAAETAEGALRLAQTDRQRLQVALTSLGFDTRGNDGVFGPHTRDMISAWQRARNQPGTGYLNAGQQQALQREAATALQKYDEDQKKKEEDQKKADEAAKAQAAAAVPGTTTPAGAAQSSAPSSGEFDGNYGGSVEVGGPNASSNLTRVVSMSVRISGRQLTGQGSTSTCGSFSIALPVSPTGEISGRTRWPDPRCGGAPVEVLGYGSVKGNSIQLEIAGPGFVARGTLTKGAAAPPPSLAGAFDGSYVGGANMSVPAGANQQTARVAQIVAQISGSKLTGLATTACGTFQINLSVSPSGDISGNATVPDALQCAAPLSAKATGRVGGTNLQLDMVAIGLHIQGTLVKQ